MLISLIIPTLNERDSIPALFERLEKVRGVLAARGQALELVFVDDGSTDGTRELIKKVGASAGGSLGGTNPFIVHLIERSERGLATAVLKGFEKATGEILGVIDADLSHPPELIPRMLEELSTADIVIGSRHVPGGGVEEWPWHRRLFSASASALAHPLIRGVTDPMSGFFFVHRRVVQGVHLAPLGYKILLEILVKGTYGAVKEVPYVFRNRDMGKSKMDWKVTLAYITHIVRLYWWKIKKNIKKTAAHAV